MRKAARKALAAQSEKANRIQPTGHAAPKTSGKRDESKYHKGSCAMRRIRNPDELPAGAWDEVWPGDFWFATETATVGPNEFRYRVLWAKYPDGCMACLPLNMPDEVKQAGSRGASWGFDGNLEKPTLSPSVHHIGHWHGWIRAGMMASV